VNDYAVQVIDFLLCVPSLTGAFHSLVNVTAHVLLHVEDGRILDLFGDFATQKIEPFNCDDQNSGCLCDGQTFCRVLQ